MNNSTTLDEQLKAMGEACIDNAPQQVESLAEKPRLSNESKREIFIGHIVCADDSLSPSQCVKLADYLIENGYRKGE